MKFSYYLIEKFDGVTGTNDRKLAEEYVKYDNYIVINSLTGRQMHPHHKTTPITEMTNSG